MNNIEQEFFEAFGIEKKFVDCANSWCDTNNDGTKRKKPICYNPRLGDYGNQKCLSCNANIMRYPPITPKIVWELEEILNKVKNSTEYTTLETTYNHNTKKFHVFYPCFGENRVEGITKKEVILKLCIQLKDEIQDQVKALLNGK